MRCNVSACVGVGKNFTQHNFVLKMGTRDVYNVYNIPIFRPFVNVCTCSVCLTAMPHFFLFLFTHWKTKTLNIVLRSVQLYFFIGNLIRCSQYRQNNVEKRPCLRFLKQIIDVQLLRVVLCIGWWPILPPIY